MKTTRALIAVAVLLPLLLGAGTMTKIRPRFPKKTDAPKELLDDGYHDFAGVIHIHTRYSDGAGTFEDVARAANKNRLDYIIVTDHNTLRPLRDGKQGWYGTTLVLVGEEISTRAGHYLALNVTQEINRDQPTQGVIDDVNRQGGLGFIAHPYFKKRRWTDWSVQGFTGMEIYNLVHDAFDENKFRLFLWGIMATSRELYMSLLTRPYDPLGTWDELLRRHPAVVGIGSADAHEVRAFGVKFAPYEILFHIVRTHVLTTDETLSAAAVYDALRRGHCYASIDLVTEAKGFTLMADDGAQVLGVMGDAVALAPDLELTAVLPDDAVMTLYKDGRAGGTQTGRLWRIPVTEPGVYRLEAFRNQKPWIFSNPIYVRPQPAVNNDAAAGR